MVHESCSLGLCRYKCTIAVQLLLEEFLWHVAADDCREGLRQPLICNQFDPISKVRWHFC